MKNLYIILLLLIISIYLLNIINNNLENFINLSNNLKTINNNIVSTEKCFLDRCELCPMRSFKQCTNNHSLKLYPPLSRYPCNNINNIIPNRISEKKSIINLDGYNENILIGPENNPRVNIWNIL